MNSDYLANPWEEGGTLASDWGADNAKVLFTSSVSCTQGKSSSQKAQPIPTSGPDLFIDELIKYAGPVVKANRSRLPPAAMVACAIVESGYGTSSIYQKTGCPFNLQRPSGYTWVHCTTIPIRTCVKTDQTGKCIDWKVAPFCVAAGNNKPEKLADSARIWCEWICGWPQKKVRETMLKLRDNPILFTKNLPSVGFGEANKRKQNGDKFVAVLHEHNLVSRCSSIP